MQVFKFVLAVCATTVCAGFICVQAQDTPAQAAARAALMQSMGEPPPAAPAVPATQSTPAAAAAPAAETNAPILVESSGVVAQQTNAPAETNEIATPAPAAPAAETNAPAATTAAPVAATSAAASQPVDPTALAAARAALLQAMGQPAETAPATVATPAAANATAPVVVAPAPAQPVAPEVQPVAPAPAKPGTPSSFANAPGFTPIVAPPLPISAAKQQQLDALLVKYQADQISPEEYHTQRAAILAEP